MTSESSGSRLSYERTFDGLIDIKPLLFRLHSPKYCATIFDEKKKVLRASRHAAEHRNSSEEPSALKALAEFPSSLTPDEESDAVERHITSWVKKSKEPSNFISLTFNVLFVLWEWKRRRFHQTYRSEDDFIIIVLNSSALRGRAKLGIEMIKDQGVYNLTDFSEEVIVASSIQSSAILGTMPMSQLENFIPSWCQESLKSLKEDHVSEEKAGLGFKFKSFLRKLEQPAVQGDDCTRQSLRFALELLDPMLVSAKQRRADTENVFNSVAKEHPRDESENSTDHSSHATALRQTVAGKGGSLAAHRSRSCPSLGWRNRLGTIPYRVSPHAFTFLRQFEGGRVLEDTTASAHAERGGQDSVGPYECEYVGALATDVSCIKPWRYRKKFRRMCTEIAHYLLSEGSCWSEIEKDGGELPETL